MHTPEKCQWSIRCLILVLVLIPVLIAFSAVPSRSQDNEAAISSGFRIQVFPIPQSVTHTHMPISFHGRVDEGRLAGDDEAMELPDPGGGTETSGTAMSRFRANLFQLLHTAVPVFDAGAVNPVETMPGIRTHPAAESSGLSLEIQADIDEQSGALLFVMKI